MPDQVTDLLSDIAPHLHRALTRGGEPPHRHSVPDIRVMTLMLPARDDVHLATDLYFPPPERCPAIAVRTPYGRATDALASICFSLARRGYVVVAQDCRGTGGSEPDSWDYYVREPEDSFDLVEWISQQKWFDGFLAAFGGSYVGQTQWCMSVHPKMSTIVPEVSGLGIAFNSAHLHMFCNAYARSVGRGTGKAGAAHYSDLEHVMLEETLAEGYFNEPLHTPFSEALVSRYPCLRSMAPGDAKRWLWKRYCSLSCAERAELIKIARGISSITMVDVEALSELFGHRIPHDAHTLPYANRSDLCRALHAPALMTTGWYDWGLNDALETWTAVTREAAPSVRSRTRLVIAPSAHNVPGYHEGVELHPELQHNHRTASHLGLILQWYAAVREGKEGAWPKVIYYLMGANEWRVVDDWPPPQARQMSFHLGSNGRLVGAEPENETSIDTYTFDPNDPSPTVGGSIVSSVYPAGSVDVSAVQNRPDILTYSTPTLEKDLDLVGPLKVVLYASSSAVDTDFSARLSDVFRDGRAIQIQSGLLRARYRDPEGDPQLLEPGRIYCFEIDMWATANRFRAGHRLRIDISSADFPRFDRNSNRGGEPGLPVPARQSIYHGREYPSRLVASVLPDGHNV